MEKNYTDDELLAGRQVVDNLYHTYGSETVKQKINLLILMLGDCNVYPMGGHKMSQEERDLTKLGVLESEYLDAQGFKVYDYA